LRYIELSNNASENTDFHYAKGADRLATPWQVAMSRAEFLATLSIPEGQIVDPACGSGIQMAAFSKALSRPALGIELDEDTGEFAAQNIGSVLVKSSEVIGNSGIIIGDGREAKIALESARISKKIGFLHLDPARPKNSRTHGLDEMAPQIGEILSAWKPHMSTGESGPAIMLDLSPRLTDSLRAEVEEIVDSIWPNIGRTWEWTSRGRGRIDRLSLWLGAASSRGIERRFVRIPPGSEPTLTIEGDGRMEDIELSKKTSKPGDMIAIIDSALVESGLTYSWFEQVLSGQSVEWLDVKGRRPMIRHSGLFKLPAPEHNLLIQAKGRVMAIFQTPLDEEKLELIIDKAQAKSIGDIRIRARVDPRDQPIFQSMLDRCLDERAKARGFVCNDLVDGALLLCLMK
tara:strand:- start:109 stop:1314 length:1206 start_codon:yes stop_codon:yes gene_type:complete